MKSTVRRILPFLCPAEKSGQEATRCGWVCRDSFDAAEDALDDYIEALQTEAIEKFDEFNLQHQRGISGEGGGVWRELNWTFMENGVHVTKPVDVGFGISSENWYHWDAPSGVTWSTQCPE